MLHLECKLEFLVWKCLGPKDILPFNKKDFGPQRFLFKTLSSKNILRMKIVVEKYILVKNLDL